MKQIIENKSDQRKRLHHSKSDFSIKEDFISYVGTCVRMHSNPFPHFFSQLPITNIIS